MINESKTFCMHPFTGLATREDGAIKVCCRSLPVGYIQEDTLENIWNNDAMLRIRKQVLTGQRPKECEPCFSLEDQGVQSLRTRHISGIIPEARIKLYPNAVEDLRSDYSMPFEIPTIEVKLNNLCNLKCRMCHPMDSTSWNDWKEVEDLYIKEGNFLPKKIYDLNLINKPYLSTFDNSTNWWESFEKLLPHFRRVEFAGGEPLMDPGHYKILEMLKPYGHQIELKYATNGTTLGISKGRDIFTYWPHFKSIAVNVSIDGIHDVYEHIRGNAKFSIIEDNIKKIQQMPNISRIVGAFTAQAGNIMQVAECIDYFTNVLGIVFYSNRVSYPKCLSSQVLPKELKEIAIQRMLEVKERIPSFSMVREHPILEKILLRQIEDKINYLNAKDMSHLWDDFIEFNTRLDASRGQMSIIDLVPEFKDYVS